MGRFWDAAKDWALAVGNPDEWERRRAARQLNIAASREGLVDFIAEMQQQLDERTKHQRLAGHRISLNPYVMEGTFDGQLAVVKFYENGDSTRMDIYYGGSGTNPMENEDHGHVVVKDEQIVEWLLPGQKGQRGRAF